MASNHGPPARHRIPGGSGPEAGAPGSRRGEEAGRLAGISWKHARRAGIVILGAGLLVVGAALIVLPGPAIAVLPVGLAILATEFPWARRLLRRMRLRFRGSRR